MLPSSWRSYYFGIRSAREFISVGTSIGGARSWCMGKALLILVLIGLLGAAIWVAVVGWNLGDDQVVIAGHGYAAMALGILFSLVVGCGLMALTFYSSRTGHDEPPHRVTKDE